MYKPKSGALAQGEPQIAAAAHSQTVRRTLTVAISIILEFNAPHCILFKYLCACSFMCLCVRLTRLRLLLHTSNINSDRNWI